MAITNRRASDWQLLGQPAAIESPHKPTEPVMQDCTPSLSQDKHLFRHLLPCERAKVMEDGEMKEGNGSCAAENFSKGRTAPSAVYDCNRNRLRGGSERWAPLSAATNSNADTSAANCRSDEGRKLRVASALKITKMSYWHHLSPLCTWNTSPCENPSVSVTRMRTKEWGRLWDAVCCLDSGV